MEGLAEQFFSFSDVVASRVEDEIGGVADTTGSNENDRYIEGGSVSDNMLAEITDHGVDDDILEGVDVKSSNIVGDDGLANQMVPTSSTLSLKCSRLEENVVNTKNDDKAEDHCISSSQTHQLFVSFPPHKWYYIVIIYIFAPPLAFCNAYGCGLTDWSLAITYGKLAIFVIGAWAGASHGGVLAGLADCGVISPCVFWNSNGMCNFTLCILPYSMLRVLHVQPT
ncbi:probable metal-nicotianamine transporter YSL7 [Olea europaea subsp. europaea]|uniref:Probable metal-nicotianamine transporter YSL7 n=1 Tax=Olea europaea subsp. europaea TaxID=158383 RepID=A0A8S0Q3P1_OLEEU|nr:probable metal-nicotianamine transporter YSL7 [Olea europaea subsp. europaea]